MSRLQELHPDQEAVLQLVLRRRMAYADLAGALGLEPGKVRERALDAVDGLAPDDVPGLELGDRDRIADLLLGQGAEEERAATRELLRTHPPAHAWAETVAAELAPLGGPREDVPPAATDAPSPGGTTSPEAAETAARQAFPGPLPQDPAVGAGASPAGGDPVPTANASPLAEDGDGDGGAAVPPADAATTSAAATPLVPAGGGSGDVRDAFAALDADRADADRTEGSPPRRRSRGLLALGVVALVIAALVVAWVSGAFDKGGDDGPSASAPAATTTSTSGADQDAADAQAFLAALPKQINFNPPSGAQGAYAEARGVAQSMLSQSTGAPVLALVTENMPKATSKRRYFAWADKLGDDPILLGQLTDARGAELPFTGADVESGQAVAVDPSVYNRIRITRSGAGSSAPRKPGPTVLVGTLTLRSAG